MSAAGDWWANLGACLRDAAIGCASFFAGVECELAEKPRMAARFGHVVSRLRLRFGAAVKDGPGIRLRMFATARDRARVLTREAMANGITGALLAHFDGEPVPYGATSAGWLAAANSADDVRGALRIPPVFEEREDLGLRWRPKCYRARAKSANFGDEFRPHRRRLC